MLRAQHCLSAKANRNLYLLLVFVHLSALSLSFEYYECTLPRCCRTVVHFASACACRGQLVGVAVGLKWDHVAAAATYQPNATHTCADTNANTSLKDYSYKLDSHKTRPLRGRKKRTLSKVLARINLWTNSNFANCISRKTSLVSY